MKNYFAFTTVVMIILEISNKKTSGCQEWKRYFRFRITINRLGYHLWRQRTLICRKMGHFTQPERSQFGKHRCVRMKVQVNDD